MVFQGSRLVFHDYRWNVLVIYGPRKFLRLVMVPCRCFMIPGWFLWFALFQVGLNPEPEAQSEMLGTSQKIPA